MGFAYLAMDRPDLAETNYREAVRLQPGYVTAWNNLGDSLERRGKFREALNAYEVRSGGTCYKISCTFDCFFFFFLIL